ncbi:SpvB/TcaC N-terminal domain-containing protein [Phaeovulum sp.]|uniref:SpvB/TcaC N-terminal domain-containing protein n=1 Tax=Phaeovulum sp. TaxID=2934796 RepID=UPI0027307973|nr:SpvB/TcaC N-terminal domain-containing protein [Phaeovulum sp.]MDP1669525.1 SpvB/TcaC N-terminal domain-containing protein [Phaeovulum sp.]
MFFRRYSLIIALLSLSTLAFSFASAEEAGQAGRPREIEPDVVGAGGEFTTSVTISVPAFRDLVPSVSLNYNSSNTARSGVENLVAFGWQLGGFSKIERRSLGDGVPTYDDGQDVFVLDGMELMACGDAAATNPWPGYYPLRYVTDQASASCSSGGNLVSRVEDYRRIVFDSTSNSFTVTRTDGVSFVYRSIGELAGDASAAGTPARNYATKSRWLLSEIRDTQATPNTVTYSCSFALLSQGYAHRPLRIAYAGYKVEFTYTVPTQPMARFATGVDIEGIQAYQQACHICFAATSDIASPASDPKLQGTPPPGCNCARCHSVPG